MTTKISLNELLQNEGLTLEELISVYGDESVVPAMCVEGCQVEPDGCCEHGNPSFMVDMGVI